MIYDDLFKNEKQIEIGVWDERLKNWRKCEQNCAQRLVYHNARETSAPHYHTPQTIY